MGNPRCQGDRALAGYRTNDSLALARHQPTASLAAQDSGRAIARGASADEGPTAPTSWRRTRRRFEYPRLSCTPSGSLLASISTHARVKHSFIKVQTAKSQTFEPRLSKVNVS